MDLYGLPCQRRRHGSCAGVFTVGVARDERQHACLCDCHWLPGPLRERLESEVRLQQRRTQLLPS